MDGIKEIADKVELAGNTLDTVIGWLDDCDLSDEAMDGLVDVMEMCLSSAAKLREIAGEGC